ncbi:hypothetical protein H0H93_003462 [Arthromyces matolae]|nr:hypothetical protein H0H93_003462 [Arthromyces matolae]
MLTMFNYANAYPSGRQARTSTSSSQGKSFSDLAHIRRRKSTSAKSSKPRPSLLRSPSHPSDPIIAAPLPPETPKLSIKPPKLTHAASAQPSLSPFPLFPPTSGQETPTPHANLNFSTADRAILEELKQNLRARDAQFVLKGEGSSLGSPLTSRGKKHHAFPPDKVPYPRSYEREVVDL